MTDKKIIIDGVDVARCEFCKPNPLYKIEYACHCRGYMQDNGLHVHLSCEHNPNCYYKQLKRLEQENAELKAKNERLKEENKTLEQFLSKEPLALQALQKGYASYKESTDVFYQMVKTYKQTLQEIKAIAENQDLYRGRQAIATKILKIITKAEINK